MDVLREKGELHFSYLKEFTEKLSAIESQLLLRKRYYEQYRIADMSGDRSDTPFPLLSKNRHESLEYTKDPLREFTERFIRAKVHQYTGLSLKEFLELNREQTDLIFESCEKYQSEHLGATEDELNSFMNELDNKHK